MRREASTDLEIYVSAATTMEFQIAVASHPGAYVTELLTFKLDGRPITAWEIVGPHGNRIHKLDAQVGVVTAHYEATVIGRADPMPVTDYDQSLYLRPSRYAESDKFFGFAAAQFGSLAGSQDLLAQVSSWVGTHLIYVPGSSNFMDSAVDTLLAGRGICRDYTHLVVALLRALYIPARHVAVYAPGCNPMDFHVVAEACVDGLWRVVDATCLAPRSTMVRISTGRDSADTAFLDNHGGEITLNQLAVYASVDGQLPYDDIRELVSAG